MKLVLPILLLAACSHSAPTPAAADAAAPAAKKSRLRVEMDSWSRAVLFAAEVHQLEDAVGAWLVARGHEVVPRADLARVAGLALAGARVSDGQACGAPTSPRQLFATAFADAGKARVRVVCASEGLTPADCTLEVEAGEERFAAEVPGQPELAGLLAALPRLAAAPATPRTGAFAGITDLGDKPSSGGPRRGLGVLTVHLAGPWSGEVDRTVLSERLAACKDDRDQKGVRFEVDAAGKVIRCEHDADERHPVNFACFCDGLRAVELGAGPAGRRGELRVIQWGEPVRDAAGSWLSVKLRQPVGSSDDPSVNPAVHGLSASTLATCFAGQSIPEGKPIDLDWEIGTDGSVDAVRFSAPGWPEPVTDCVGKELARARFACPQKGRPVTFRSWLGLVRRSE